MQSDSVLAVYRNSDDMAVYGTDSFQVKFMADLIFVVIKHVASYIINKLISNYGSLIVLKVKNQFAMWLSDKAITFYN